MIIRTPNERCLRITNASLTRAHAVEPDIHWDIQQGMVIVTVFASCVIKPGIHNRKTFLSCEFAMINDPVMYCIMQQTTAIVETIKISLKRKYHAYENFLFKVQVKRLLLKNWHLRLPLDTKTIILIFQRNIFTTNKSYIVTSLSFFIILGDTKNFFSIIFAIQIL